MSSSLRGPKDRGNGFGCGTAAMSAAVSAPKSTSTLKAMKLINPVSTSDKVFHGKFFAGKENARSTSRGHASVRTQKPMIQPVARVDKASLVGAGSDVVNRVLKSASSIPRGRSSSPSDFTRVISDMRKDRRVSVDRVEKAPIGGKVARNGGNFREMQKKVGENEMKCKEVKLFENGDKKMILRSGSLMKSRAGNIRSDVDEKGTSESEIYEVKDGNGVSEVEKGKSCAVLGSSVEKVEGGSSKDSNLVPCVKGSASDDNLAEVLNEKVSGDNGVGSLGGKTYQSRLHEKLAFVEGKVKRIASDIRTKEMLDMNNHDASKVILSDIHDKLSGLEEAIGHVTATNSDTDWGSSKNHGNACTELTVVDRSQTEPTDKSKPSVKGLSCEDLEAYFLIKNC